MGRATWVFLQLVPRRDSRGPLVFAVVILMHVGIIATLADSARTRASRKKAEPVEPLVAIFIDHTDPATPVKDDAVVAPLPSADIARALVMPTLPEVAPAPDEPRNTSSPDWSAAMTSIARDAIARQAQRDAGPHIGVHPKGMTGPRRKLHAPGEMQELGDGEVLTWVNDYCYYSNRTPPLSNGFGGVKPFCADVPPRYQSLDDWVKSRRKLADERDDE